MPKRNRKGIFRKWFYGFKFSNKIAIMYGLVFMVVIFLVSTFIIFNVILNYMQFYKAELEDVADDIVAYVEATGDTDIRNIIGRVNNEKILVRVMELGDEFAGRADEIDRKEFERREPMPPGSERPGGFTGQYLSVVRIAHYDKCRFAIMVERGKDTEARLMKTSVFLLLAVNCLGIAGAALAGKYMSKKILQPIIAITNTAERIGIEDLSRRIEYEGPADEIMVLADTFNEMIDRLEVAFEKQNQFISDASHELRTPISVIQGYANLIDRWGKDDPAILQESIDSIISETEHMSKLVKKLLFLAKNENSRKMEGKRPVCLNQVMEDVIKELNVLEITQDLTFYAEEEVYIFGDADLMKQMIWIFVENSMKYASQENGKIALHVYKEDGKACISVKDNGIGISEEDLPYIFERFYRADKSRSKEVPGTGIGLSVADWIIKNHDGKVTVDSFINQGTEIIVYLPLLEQYDNIIEEKK